MTTKYLFRIAGASNCESKINHLARKKDAVVLITRKRKDGTMEEAGIVLTALDENEMRWFQVDPGWIEFPF